MNTRILTQTFVLALAMMVTLTIGSSVAFGQDKDDKQSGARDDARTEARDNALVGVWESVSPGTVDCQTGVPDPNAPIIRALYNFMQGGTMTEENTDPIEGPYRNTAHGIWKRTSGRNYTAVFLHYGYLPDRTHLVIVKVRSHITLKRDSNSFTQNGTFEVLDANGNPLLDPNGNAIRGCFRDTATRLRF